MSPLQVIGAVVGIVGGLVGIIGGIAGLIARYRAPRLEAAFTDFVGIVVSQDRSTWKLHLPMLLSNMSNKPGAITHIAVQVQGLDDRNMTEFQWGLFWLESPAGDRSPDHRPTPIPLPGLNTAEKGIQFEAAEPVEFVSQVYECTVHLRLGRDRQEKRVSRFYFRPSRERCLSWYKGPPLDGPTVDQVPIYMRRSDVPEHGD